jgi:hypothetical protein
MNPQVAIYLFGFTISWAQLAGYVRHGLNSIAVLGAAKGYWSPVVGTLAVGAIMAWSQQEKAAAVKKIAALSPSGPPAQ